MEVVPWIKCKKILNEKLNDFSVEDAKLTVHQGLSFKKTATSKPLILNLISKKRHFSPRSVSLHPD
jgi:hypothetical protein